MFVRVRNWVADATAGVRIRADYHDTEDDGFADGLSHCITKDGQTTITQNIPMNGKRITSLQDPIDPQDTATKAYADLMLPLTGGTITGNLTVTGSVGAIGYKTRAGAPGPFGASVFNFNWTGNLEAWIDNSNIGNLATQAYVEQRASDWAHAVADPKVNRAGDTVTGPLTVNGELVAAATYLRFQYAGSPGYILWNGGATYTLGGGGTIWHTGNLNPVIGMRLVNAGQTQVGIGWNVSSNGWLMNGVYWAQGANGTPNYLGYINWNYLQVLTPGGYVTVGF